MTLPTSVIMYTFDTNPIIYYIDDEPAAVAMLDDLFVQASDSGGGFDP